MEDSETLKKLTWIANLQIANLVVMFVLAAALLFGLLPKIERAVQTTERVELRFQAFADEVQPVVTAGAVKAIESIRKMDADQLSEKATQKTNALIDAATDRAKRFLESDKNKK
ncbi:MAG: hypothetical protein JNM18_14580 [Planctomycetaceae bacterium]|nr:hypothetical protein [Planctomycetaceae bacterium]